MKQTLLIIALVFCIQSNQAQTKSISYVSPKKDTLVLPNDELGKTIGETWGIIPIKEQPVIIFADEEIIYRKNLVLYENRKKKQNTKN